MPAPFITEETKSSLESYVKKFRKPELVNVYLHFLEQKHRLKPVIFARDKIIYQNVEEAVQALEKEGKLWRETEIKIGFGPPTINEETKKIYICPFTGKAFGDNTESNPQDAIYEWVSRCPENTERVGGLKVKRFFVSEDPEIIKKYIVPRQKVISKIVFSSAINGKLFNSKEAVIEDFKRNYLKPTSLVEAQSQNRFKLDDHFVNFIQDQLQETKVAEFVEALSKIESFKPYVSQWVEEQDEES